MGKEQELLEAARTGNVGLVEKLLSGKKGLLGSGSGSIPLPGLLSMWRGVNVNCADGSGYTPLHHASLNGHRDVVLKLLQFEASTNVADSKGCFPLHLAAWRGDVDIVQILIHHGPSHSRVNEQNHEKETALHCAAQYGHSEVVRVLLQELTDPSMRNSRGETPLDLAALYGRLQVVRMLLTAHPNLMSCNTRKHTPLHLAARNGHHTTVRVLLEADMDVNTQVSVCGQDIFSSRTPHTLHTPFRSRSQLSCSIVTERVLTGELSKLLNEIKICRDKDCSFEELCQTISSHSQSMESFGSGRLSDEEQNGTLTRINKGLELFEEKSCGPSGLWKALTPCNGCRNLGFSQDKRCAEIAHSPSLDVFLPEDEDNPYESVATAVTRKPCSLDIHRHNACPRSGYDAERGNHGDDFTGLTPDCSPPSPDTALRNIERVIRPQPKQRTSLSSSQDVQKPLQNHSGEPSEVSSSLGYASFSTSPPASPPISPANCSIGSVEDYGLTDDRRNSHVPEQFAGLLHGSSPACESPDNPYQLYSKVRKFSVPEPPLRHGNFLRAPEYSPPFPRTGSEASALKTQKEAKPQIVYRTIFHTQVNQGPLTLTESGNKTTGVHVRNGEVRSKSTGSSNPASSNSGYEERACTLGRMRSMPKNVLDLQLSRNFSKSDSNLVAVSPIEEEQWSSRGQNSPGKSSPNRLERTPSFTAEWEEIDKIMSSIGAGIGTELEGITEDHSGPRCPVQSVGQWTDNIGLVQYENHLLSNGFDNVQFMGSNVVEDQDLLEIGILNSAHRQRLLQAIRLLPRVRPIGYDGNNPTSVAEWLESLELGDYTKSFLINGYTSMELVKKIWEIELINVLKINLIGHRKRILASLGDRLHEDPPQKPPRAISLREPTGNHTPPQLSPSLSQAYPNAGSLDVQHLIMQADARRRRNNNYFEDVPRSKLERQMAQQGEWCEPITLRPPNEATSSTPVQYWQHHPEKLIFQSCDYEAYYLGSILVKELRGTESTHDACAKMRVRKSTEQMKKIPTIVLSVSYKGVKFIDATNKNIIAEHEIRNISCAAQDPEDLSTFAYITKDLKSSHHYCHVFTAFDVNLAYEIILTLGQAFEVAYQLALQARKSGHGSSTLPESFDSKPSKPVPKPRVNIRKSVSDFPSMDQKGHANVPWIVEPGQEAKRGANTKYETTIF
uniref:Ankyrin repeat and sterile alpha motif domain-containing protein 1B-like n=1 Tax=Sinocyclocheilus rhinocerous TaxID=307959 RepID=A0A673IWN0_9TELE